MHRRFEPAALAHESEYQRLRGELQAAHDASRLPELPSEETRAALNAPAGQTGLKTKLIVFSAARRATIELIRAAPLKNNFVLCFEPRVAHA